MPIQSRIAFFGDVVGLPGLRAFEHAASSLRQNGRADLIIVNGENLKNGSGITPEGYKDLRRAGADAITLGDHWLRDKRITELLDDPDKPICRPANLSRSAPGKRWARLTSRDTSGPPTPAIFVVTVLGRLFMSLPANDPFEAVDREVAAIESDEPLALIIIEAHCEATSEKQAMAWHCLRRWPNRVMAVVGSHTHVLTADARLLQYGDHALAALTDLGMCGGHGGVIGRTADSVLQVMTTQNPTAYSVEQSQPKACGCIITIDTQRREPIAIESFAIEWPA